MSVSRFSRIDVNHCKQVLNTWSPSEPGAYVELKSLRRGVCYRFAIENSWKQRDKPLTEITPVQTVYRNADCLRDLFATGGKLDAIFDHEPNDGDRDNWQAIRDEQWSLFEKQFAIVRDAARRGPLLLRPAEPAESSDTQAGETPRN